MEFDRRHRNKTFSTKCKEIVVAAGMLTGVLVAPKALVEGVQYSIKHDFFPRGVVLGGLVLAIGGIVNKRLRTQESRSTFHITDSEPTASSEPIFIPNHRLYRDTDLRQISNN